MDKKKELTRIERCRHAHHSWKDGKIHCIKKEGAEVTNDICEKCETFKSKYIEFPLTINGIDAQPIKTDSLHCQTGALVAVQPCEEEYQGKTFLGFFLGELPLSIIHSFNQETGILCAYSHRNPAMFVPELGKIIWGCASWWSEIKSKEDFKEITDNDIENTWYVQLAKKLKDYDYESKEHPIKETEE